ncbi:LacI family DNA-binding transcriptional regulator [Sinorhizobium sp. BG8]|uniref:LacI family DNA-binding transcriptional regulator n=1 Tax=Sinorhizobium sp. BG8 TaxID=2613773 RepID=UPI00193D6D06|nr:LacI family DNA-binding transcriptional regulator [Sinorhizobium sp. BG8]QRM57123.1 LacI family transcriptional regulator [Sinorhizobium sp. BG8]
MTVQRKRNARATIHDVAREVGVSVSTVSKALNDSGRMAVETRARIKQVAEDIGFRPSALARGLLFNRSFTIGLLTNDTYGRFTLPVMAGVSEALVDKGVSVFLCAIEDDPALGKVHVDAMLDKQVDGIIATGKRIDRSLPVDLSGLSVPVVYAFTEGAPDSVTLTSDDAHGAGLATEWLIGLGRKKLVHITGPEDFASVRERRKAFRAHAGADAEVLCGIWAESWGHEAIAELWARDAEERPDGIVCGNDQIARGVIDALRERGVRVPDDVSVVGFDNWEIMAAQARPPLTSVDMNLKELGKEAGRTMLALAEGKYVEPGLRKLPCRLVVRRSCGGRQSE